MSPRYFPSPTSSRNREWLAFLAFAGPGLILFALFNWWPILYSAYLSLTDWKLPARSPEFIGFGNYAYLLTDTRFWRVALNTAIYAGVVVLCAQVLAFGLAAFLSRPLLLRPVWRTLAFTPYVTTPAAAALVWVMLLDPQLGPLSQVYSALGVEGPRWPAHGVLALGAIILVGIWKETAFGTVFFIAGRQNLAPEYLEAAEIDGAGGWQRLLHVTLPMLTPIVFVLAISGVIAAAKVFDTVALMTAGGPVYPDSSTFVYHLYTLGFREYELGRASAFAILFFVFLAGFTAAQFRASRRWVHLEN